ncbi:BMP family ABC transporter substrate-binding protein [Clostridia bacterium]|nr:BMP family ABC transporter substrate-binding protein [Clostridia bacterium]
MKKLCSIVLALSLSLALLAGCGTGSTGSTDTGEGSENGTAAAVDVSKIKVGAIYIGDENEGYTAAHMQGIKAMQKALGLSDSQIIEKKNIKEDQTCYDAAVDLADQGCNIIFGNSFGYEDYMLQAAKEFPKVQFCHATGYKAASSGLSNFHNYFTSIYEARYLAGVVAGLKLTQLITDGSITADQAKIGYVGAYPYAEVISGYTSFFLGAKSVCPSVTMEVRYTNSWGSIDLEKECAGALIADGCKLISQHADTTGAAVACQSAKIPVVGYNISMISAAPTEALTSAVNHWEPYYSYAVKSILDGTTIKTDWCEGFSDGSVDITELNDAVVAPGTAEKVDEVKVALTAGTLHVFDTATFTVEGKSPESFTDAAGNELIFDGYFHESEFSSAPSFNLLIDGIQTVQ